MEDARFRSEPSAPFLKITKHPLLSFFNLYELTPSKGLQTGDLINDISHIFLPEGRELPIFPA
jgi:hypothetical protein